jgi:catechol 2,3-dioxygenase-like lactoylglutathione lyase family enzyme
LGWGWIYPQPKADHQANQGSFAMTQSLPLLKGVHHSAYRCRDAEETRAFYQDVLGLPLRAALVIEEEPGTGKALPYMHLFFEMADGNFVGFFDMPEGSDESKFKIKSGFDLHIAMEASSRDEMMAYKARLDDAKVKCFGPIDHHFVESIYFFDPNGLPLEITCRTQDHDRIMIEESGNSREAIAAWSARKAADKATAA